jgi:hypothetical protein
MRAFWVISAFVVFILCGQIPISGPAYAGCCYYPNCNCVGTKCSGSCPYCCGYRSPEIFQSTFLTGNAMWEKTIQDPLPLTVSGLDIAEKSTILTRGGECARRSFTLRMLGNPEDAVKVASIGFGAGISQNPLVLQIEAQNRE